jgi:hypothetical protein
MHQVKSMARRKTKSKSDDLLEDQKDKTICKPCLELNYCPYGPLVEQFPLPYNTLQDAEEDKMSKTDREKTCTVFGHICPVYFASEPFTETGQLRYVSRHIPRPI